jgi:DNA modification methylase
MKAKLIEISKLVEVPELKNFYSEQSNLGLKHSIEESGLKTPIVIDRNYKIIDGYLRTQFMKELGHVEIPAIVVADDATLDERITRNISRVKTPQDHINEMRRIFKKYPKRQGKRKNGEEPYVRDEKISAALGGKWKGDTMINKLEKILFNDLEGDVLSKGIVEHGWKIDTCHEFLTKWKEIDETNKYGYTEKLVSGEFKINEVNKFISDREFLENEYQDTFVIPEKAESFKINSLDFGKIERFFKTIALIFTSIPYYFLRKYDNGDPEQNGLEETKYEYCDRISRIFKSLEPTLRDDANVIINIGETYDNGIGLGIPDLLKMYIEKNANLVYKDRLVWSKSNPKPQNEKVKRPINNVEYLLWFVVDKDKAKYKQISYTDGTKSIKINKGVRDIDADGNIWNKQLSLGKPYKKIYTHINEQEIQNIINLKVSKNHDVYNISPEAHPAIMNSLLPVIPILMCTNEKDIVLDPFAGTNVVGRISILMNRVAVACELSDKYHRIGCKMVESAIDQFDRHSLDQIINIAYDKSVELEEFSKAA